MTSDSASANFGPSGRRLHDEVVGAFELRADEMLLLVEACRTADQLDDLDRIIGAEGPTIDGKVHPALVEARQLRLVLARLLASLRLPDEADARPQRRGTVRGVYADRGTGGRRAAS